MLIRVVALLAAVVVIGGCASFSDVTDTDDDSVHVVVYGTRADSRPALPLAEQACGLHNRDPVMLSRPEGLCVERSWFFGICTARQFVFACTGPRSRGTRSGAEP